MAGWRINSPEELFSVHLIQLTCDVLDRILQSRDDNVLDSVDSTIGCTDDLIEDHERRLEGSELDQSFDRLGVDFLCT